MFYWVLENLLLYAGSLWNVQSSVWFWLAIMFPILHQVYVLLCWRVELFYQGISKKLGKSGFVIFKIGFTLLFVARLVSIILLAVSTSVRLNIDPALKYILISVFIGLSGYLFYSVRMYFGFDRAVGEDHFEPERYRTMSFVKRGIFNYSNNAMYVFGFLILYVPGLLLESEAAFLVALFNHVYIWVHYLFTELPDMKIIYSD
jgi:hypothetical protein